MTNSSSRVCRQNTLARAEDQLPPLVTPRTDKRGVKTDKAEVSSGSNRNLSIACHSALSVEWTVVTFSERSICMEPRVQQFAIQPLGQEGIERIFPFAGNRRQHPLRSLGNVVPIDVVVARNDLDVGDSTAHCDCNGGPAKPPQSYTRPASQNMRYPR